MKYGAYIMLEMIFGYFLIWLLGAVIIGGGWIGFFLIRLKVSLQDPFVIGTRIVFEIFWLAAVLIYIFFPDLYERIGDL